MRTYGGRKRRYGTQRDFSHSQIHEISSAFSLEEGSELSGSDRSRESSPQTPKASPKKHLDLTQDFTLLLSPPKSEGTPRKSRRTSASLKSLSTEEGSDEDAEHVAEWMRRKPLSSSVASRMAPRPAKRYIDIEKVQAWPFDRRTKGDLRSKCMSKKVNECSPDRRQCYGGLDEVGDHAYTARNGQSRAFSSVGIVLTAMQGRWRDLDEMENSDGAEASDNPSNEFQSTSSNLKTITDLRITGENQQFIDEFEYMTAGLKPSCKPKVRSSICRELFERLGGATDHSSSRAARAKNAHTFLANVRAAGLLGCLFDRLLASSSDLGDDPSADVDVAMIIGKILEDASMRDELIVKESVWKLLWSNLDKRYLGDSHSAEVLKDQGESAQALALHPHTEALRAINQLAKHATTRPRMQHLLAPYLERCSDILWIFFRSIEPTIEGGISLATLAAIEECSNSLARVQETITVHEKGLAGKPSHFTILMTTMMDKFEVNPSRQDGILKSLCAVLRLLVSMCNNQQSRFVHDFSCDQSAVRTLTSIFMHACKTGVGDMHSVTDDAIVMARWFDIAALCLGTLTTILERESNTFVATLLVKDGRTVYELGSMLKTLVDNNEERTTIMAGCLAVALAVLILKADQDKGRPSVLIHLFKSMNVKDSKEVCDLLISSLHRLVNDTTDRAGSGMAAICSFGKETKTASQRDLVDTLTFELQHLHAPLEKRQATTDPHSTAFPHFLPHSIV